MPRDRAELLLGLFIAPRRGAFAAVDPTLEQLLGRRPATVRKELEAMVGAG